MGHKLSHFDYNAPAGYEGERLVPIEFGEDPGADDFTPAINEIHELEDNQAEAVEAYAQVVAFQQAPKMLRDVLAYIVDEVTPALDADLVRKYPKLQLLADQRSRELTRLVCGDLIRRCLINNAKLPMKIRRRIQVVDVTFGLELNAGESASEKAKQRGVKRQAIHNEKKKLCDRLGIEPPKTRSSKKHTENNAKRNYRKIQ